MSQQLVGPVCVYRGVSIPGVKGAINQLFKIPVLQPYQDVKDEILKLPKKIDVRCLSLSSDLKNPLAIPEIIKRPKTQKAVLEFLMTLKSTGSKSAEEAINKMKEIANGIILTLVPEEKIKTVIEEINSTTKKKPPYTDLLSVIKDAQDQNFKENIKSIIRNIKNDLNKSLKKMNSLNNQDFIIGIQDPNHITKKCGLTVPPEIQAKIDAYKNAVGDAQSQVANAQNQLANAQNQLANAQGALNNPQGVALAAAQNNPAAAAAMGKAANLQGKAANLQGQAANLQGQAANLKGQTTNLKGKAANLKGQTTNLKGQMRNATDKMKSNQKSMGTFGGKRKSKKRKSKKRKSKKRKSKRKKQSRKRKSRKRKSRN